MWRNKVTALFNMIFLWVFTINAHGDISKAYDWLHQQQFDDGHISSIVDISTNEQSTAEALEAYVLYSGNENIDEEKAKEYLKANITLSSEQLSRALLLGLKNIDGGESLSDLLLARQNEDGGFGDQEHYASTVFDTYWAVVSLSHNGGISLDSRLRAIQYLVRQQMDNGAWGYTDIASPYLSAKIALYLNQYKNKYINISESISKAEVYLSKQVRSDALINHETFTIASVLSSLSIISQSPDTWAVVSEELLKRQMVNGSWGGDVYETSLAVSALRIYKSQSGSSLRFGSAVGRIVESGSNKPIEGVIVKLIDVDVKESYSSLSGEFLIPDLEPAIYNIVISKLGYNSVSSTVRINKSEVNNLGDVALVINPVSSIITGLVVSDATGQAIEFANISLKGSKNYNQMTSSAGSFHISDTVEGSYDIVVEANGFHSYESTIDIEQGRLTQFSLRMIPSSAVKVITDVELSGRVVDSETGAIIAGALITLGDKPTASSTQGGEFIISNVQRGDYTLKITHPNYRASLLNLAIPAGSLGAIGDLKLFKINDAEVLTQSEVTVHVINAITKESLEGVEILSSTGTLLNTSSTGLATITNIDVLDFQVSTRIKDFISASVDINMQAYGFFSVLIELTPSNDPAFSSLSGHVIDIDGNALADTKISLDTGEMKVTDSNGYYEISPIQSSNVVISALLAGYHDQIATLDINRHGKQIVNFKLLSNEADIPEDSDIKIKVVDSETGESLEGVKVSINGVLGSLSTNSEGIFTQSNIEDLELNILISKGSYRDTLAKVKFSSHGSYSTTLEMKKAQLYSVLTGLVSDDDGNVIAGALVEDTDNNLSAISDSNGEYRISEIPVLDFAIRISSQGFNTKIEEFSLKSHDEYPLNITLSKAVDNKFKIAHVNVIEDEVGLDGVLDVNVRMMNLDGVDHSVLVTGYIIDLSSQNVIAEITPVVSGSSGDPIRFSSGESKELQMSWKTHQAKNGEYELLVIASKEGSFSRALPRGDVLAQEFVEFSILQQDKIVGGFPFEPPLSQAGSDTPVKLKVLVKNGGNALLTSDTYRWTISEEGGQPILSNLVSLPELKINEFVEMELGDWIPPSSGHYSFILDNESKPEIGRIASIYYVGDVASGTFSLDQTHFQQGAVETRGQINLIGVDTTQALSTDPLFDQVKIALKRGAKYVGPKAVAWHKKNRCLGCHTQSQSLLGLSSSFGKVDFDKGDTKFLFNAISSSQQQDGRLLISHPQWPNTQNLLGVWALSEWPDKESSYRTRYKSLNSLWNKRSTSSNKTYWSSEHATGWLKIQYEAASAIVASGAASLIADYRKGVADTVEDYNVVEGQTLPSEMSSITAFYSQDNWFYAGNYLGNIYKYDLDGNVLEEVYGAYDGSKKIHSLHVSNNTIYAAGTNYILTIDEGGIAQSIDLSVGEINDITVWNNEIYVSISNRNQILQVNLDGSYSIFSSVINSPKGLAVSHENTLLVANYGNLNIIELNAEGEHSIYAEGFSYPPNDLKVLPDSELLVQTEGYSSSGQSTPKGIVLVRNDRTISSIYRNPSLLGVDSFGDRWTSYNTSSRAIINIEKTTIATDLVTSYQQALPSMAEYFLEKKESQDNEILRSAFRMVGLAEIRKVSLDEELNDRIDSALSIIDLFLRSRQRNDGGWGQYSSSASDPLVTAWVGTALDYLNPSVNDPVIRNTIKYLITNQQGGGDWAGSYFSTRLGTTSMVMAYMPKALARLGGLDVELNVELPNDVVLSNFSVAPTSSLVMENGNHKYDWSLKGVTENGRAIDFAVKVDNLLAGEIKPIATKARLGFLNSFNGTTLTRDIGIPEITGTSSVSLSVNTDKTEYSSAEEVQIINLVSSLSGVLENNRMSLTIRTEDQQIVRELDDYVGIQLPSGQSVEISSTWNSDRVLAGNYQVYARLYDENDQLQTEAVSTFSIKETSIGGSPGIQYGTQVVSDKISYGQWDQVIIDGRVQNLSMNSIRNPVLAVLTVRSPENAELLRRQWVVPELTAESLKNISTRLQLNEAKVGEYTLNLGLWNAGVDEQLAEATGSFSVVEKPSQAILGSVAVDNTLIEQGAAINCTDTLKNRSSVRGVDIAYRQLVVNEDEIESHQIEGQVQIDKGASWSAIRGFNSAQLALGNYACVLQTQISNTWTTIGSAGFKVIEPPVKLAAEMSSAGRGRLLVMTDAPRQCVVAHKVSYEIQLDEAIANKSGLSAVVYDPFGKEVDRVTVSKHSDWSSIFSAHTKGLFTSASISSDNVLSLDFDSPEGLQEGYEIRLHARWSGEIEMAHWSLNSGCNLHEYLQAWQGDSRLTHFQLLAASEVDKLSHLGQHSDPFGPASAPLMEDQNNALETALIANGWDYTLVHEAHDFTRELRTGSYSTYVLLSERPWLNIMVQKEIREGIFNGRGLVVAGSHDKRNHFIEPALGIVVAGHHPWATGLNADGFGDSSEFLFRDRVQVALRAGANVSREYNLHWDQDDVEMEPYQQHGHEIFDQLFGYKRNALTQYNYGKGKSVFAGFDLLAQATAAVNSGDSGLMQLLMQSIDFVHPDTISPYVGGVVPIQINIQNEGTATAGVVQVMIEGLAVNSAEGFDLDSNNLESRFDLVEGQELSQQLYLRVLDPVNASVQATIYSERETAAGIELKEHANLLLPIVVGLRPNLVDITHTLNDLAWKYWYRPQYRVAHLKLKAAQYLLEEEQYRSAYWLLLNATNLLLLETDNEVVSIRQQIDSEIERISRLLN